MVVLLPDYLTYTSGSLMEPARGIRTSDTLCLSESLGTTLRPKALLREVKPRSATLRSCVRFFKDRWRMTPFRIPIRMASLLVLTMLLTGCRRPASTLHSPPHVDNPFFQEASRNGDLANEGFRRARLFVDGWLAHADSTSGLLPRNLREDRDIWNPKDAAADNYPFMVLTAALTDRALFEGRMREILDTETRLTSRIGALPDTYSFSRQGFRHDEPDLERILFGASEYIKDGLLPLTEWLGPSPWSDRMLAMLDEMWERAPIETPFGAIVSENVEVNGEMLQVLSRVYWMTGEQKYLAWAIRLGDYYLLGGHHPTEDSESLRLRDHGSEIVSGLTELYATVHAVLPDKKELYEAPIHKMLDRILEVGRNREGLFYSEVNPRTGEVLDDTVTDTFGYTLNGFYTVYLIDRVEAYRRATRKALKSLGESYQGFAWQDGSADGYADALEGALNLYAREPIGVTSRWIDREMQVMWQKQQADGVIEGWHGDGNFARTTLMYSLWKTRGAHVEPWRDDLELGAVRQEETLVISVSADSTWEGVLRFDARRHRTNMKLPFDWPRINQFPEWSIVDEGSFYWLRNTMTGERAAYSGAELLSGVSVNVPAGRAQYLLLEQI